MKILAIDDNRDNLTTLKGLLKEIFPECTVTSAENGQKGIDRAYSEDPDVILLDIIMPQMDGFEVCRRIKADEKLCDIPVVFLTAQRTDRENRIKALRAGAEGFLSKPPDEHELTAQIRAMVKIKAASLAQRQEKDRLEALVKERTRELWNELSRRRRTEEELRKSENHLQTLIQTIPDLIWLKDKYGVYLSSNSAFEHFCNAAKGEIIGKTDHDLVEPKLAESFRESDGRAIEAGQLISYEEWLTLPSGRRTLLEITKTPMYDDKGVLIGVLGVGHDITMRKKNEEQVMSQLAELQRWHDVMLDREDRVQELKKEVNELCRRHGEAIRYPSQDHCFE